MKRLLRLGTLGVAVLLFATGFSTDSLVAQEKVKKSESKKGWLGVAIQDISTEVKRAMKLDSRDGALVSDVTRKSPADKAGIEDKDVIVQFGAKKIEDSSDLTEAVADTKPGTKVAVVVMRKGEKKTIDVEIGERKVSSSAFTVRPHAGNLAFMFGGNTQGMVLREINEQMAKYFGLADKPGVLVWEVEEGSAAEKAGVKAGDVITLVGKKKINEIRDVSRALGIYDEGEKAELEVLRKGSRQTLTMEVEEESGMRGSAFWYGVPGKGDDAERQFFYQHDGNRIGIRVPRIEIERLRPDMDRLHIELDELKDRVREDASGIRERILREVAPKVRVRVERII